MSEIVRTVSRVFSPLIFLFGIYITIHGHLTPGGGFAGGVIIAGAIILGVLAYGGEEFGLMRKLNSSSISESFGILFFLIVAILGFIISGIFFLNFLGKGVPFRIFSAGIIPLCNIGIGIEVGGAICVVMLAFVLFKSGK